MGTSIVVGVDRSPEGSAAVEAALREAVLRGAPLLAIRAWTDAVSAGYPVGQMAPLVPTSAEEAEAQARRVAEDLVKETAPRVPGADGVDVDVRALRGGVGRTLVEAARDAALLVVGTRGGGPLSRAVLGSVAEYALHNATCPVIVVPAKSAVTGGPARVLVGVDHSAASLAALRWAAEEAARRGDALVPVLVRDGTWAGDDENGPLTELEAIERRSLRDAVPAAPGLRVEPEVGVGHPGRALLALARPPDLLVVGARGRSAAIGALLGSTSTYVVRHAQCPVAVVRRA